MNGRVQVRVPDLVVGYCTRMSEQADEGQVSEVARLDLDEVDTPISDSEHVAGYPESESGEPDEGRETGPDADQFRDREVR
jgi:hypothetical protein